MKSLTIGTTYELKDRFSLFEDYPDIKIFETITNTISGCWLADRTSIVQLPFRTELMQKHVMPDFSTIESLSLEECCSKKAHELLSDNSPIYLLYSGGIDSTLALVSLIKAGVSKDQLTVVCNTDGIRENPTFFYTHIKSKFKLMSSELFMQHARTSPLPGRAVLCEPGDALYGQYLGATAFTMFGGRYLEKPATRQNLIDFFKSKGLDDITANCCFDMYTHNINLCPREVVTMYDFFWWTHFNWRWQYNSEKLRLRTALEPVVETFYSTLEFQKWASEHVQSRIEKQSDFKKDYKQLIYEFTKDREYFELKIKHVSASYYYLSDAFMAIESDGTRLKSSNYSLMDYYQPDNFISNWIKNN